MIFFFSKGFIIALGIILIVGIILAEEFVAYIATVLSIILILIISFFEIVMIQDVIEKSGGKGTSLKISCVLNALRLFPICHIIYLAGQDLSHIENYFEGFGALIGGFIVLCIIALAEFFCLSVIYPLVAGYSPSEYAYKETFNTYPDELYQGIGLLLSIIAVLIYYYVDYKIIMECY